MLWLSDGYKWHLPISEHRGHIGATSELPVHMHAIWRVQKRARGIAALIQAAAEGTLEDPDFDGPGGSDFSAEQEKA